MSRLSRLKALLLAPILILQVPAVKLQIPSLPEAEGERHGTLPGPKPLSLLVFGDSTAMGVGAGTLDEALPGHLARSLQRRFGRGVKWHAVGRSGATTGDVIGEGYLGDAAAIPAELIVIMLGTNDTMHLRGRGSYTRNLRTIVERLRLANPAALILISTPLVFASIPVLPEPLRSRLDSHAHNLEQGGRVVVEDLPRVHLSTRPEHYTEGFFSSDRFHPGPEGYRRWAEFLLDDAGPLLERLR